MLKLNKTKKTNQPINLSERHDSNRKSLPFHTDVAHADILPALDGTFPSTLPGCGNSGSDRCLFQTPKSQRLALSETNEP